MHRTADDHDYDVLIVGAGVFGAAAAREAALNGWRVLLVDQGDFACGTSQASTKLIHGGLRYLEHGRLRLVAESLRERHVLERLAPGLVTPMPFLFPIRTGDRLRPWRLRLGLTLYDFLARRHTTLRHRWLDARAVRSTESAIRPEGLRGAGLYFDFRTDDALLTLSYVLSAERAGASVLNYRRLERLECSAGGFRAVLLDVLDDRRRVVTARIVLNTTGPWLDAVRRLLRPDAAALGTCSKGVHVVVPSCTDRHGVFFPTGVDDRLVFVVPFHGRSLIGTTDTPHDGPPEAAVVTEDEIDYLLAAAGRALGERPLRRSDVISTFVGLRSLIAEPGRGLSRLSREETILEDPPGVFQVVGGKLTTARLIAQRLLRAAAARSGLRLDDGTLSSSTPLVDSRAAALGGPPLSTRIPLSAQDVEFLIRSRHARRVADILRRRTALALTERLAHQDVAAVARVMQEICGWSAARLAVEVASVPCHE